MSLGFERLNSCRNSKWDFLFKNGTKKGEKQMKKVWTWKNTKNDINFRKNIYSKIAWQMAIGTPIVLDHLLWNSKYLKLHFGVQFCYCTWLEKRFFNLLYKPFLQNIPFFQWRHLKIIIYNEEFFLKIKIH